jgi:hypothetical protein
MRRVPLIGELISMICRIFFSLILVVRLQEEKEALADSDIVVGVNNEMAELCWSILLGKKEKQRKTEAVVFIVIIWKKAAGERTA